MKKTMTMLLVATAAVACAKHQKPASDASGLPPGRDEPVASAPMATNATRSVIVVSKGIQEACGLSGASAYFEFDSARVSTAGDGLLKKLADCFVSGPLTGEAMVLVGHADSRGSDEYNMVLGSRRAESVKSALQGFGLNGSAISTSTRGEIEATGVDADSWADDRRVDVTTGT